MSMIAEKPKKYNYRKSPIQKILFQPSKIEKIWKLFDNIQLWRKFCAGFDIWANEYLQNYIDDLSLAKSRKTKDRGCILFAIKSFTKLESMKCWQTRRQILRSVADRS